MHAGIDSSRRSIIRFSAASAVLALAVAPVRANDVTVVKQAGGPGVDYTSLYDALGAAMSGDILLLQDGVYNAPIFTNHEIDGLGLTLVVDGSASIDLNNISGVSVLNTPADEWVVMQGELNTRPLIDVCTGVVWIDAAVVEYIGSLTFGAPAMTINDSAAVHLTRSTFRGDETLIGTGTYGHHGAVFSASNLFAYDCEFLGGEAHPTMNGGGGGDGASLADATFLFAAGCAIVGGAVSGTGMPVLSGDGLSFVDAASQCAVLDTLVAAGAADPVHMPGLDVSGPGTFTALPGSAYSLSATSPVREGETCTLTLTGQPGAKAFLHVSAAPGLLYVPTFGGAIQIELAGSTTYPLGTMPPSGVKTVDVPITPIGTEGLVLFVQAHFTSGGQVGLSGGQPVVLLSAAL